MDNSCNDSDQSEDGKPDPNAGNSISVNESNGPVTIGDHTKIINKDQRNISSQQLFTINCNQFIHGATFKTGGGEGTVDIHTSLLICNK